MKLISKLLVIGLLALGILATSSMAETMYPLGDDTYGNVWYYRIGDSGTSRNGVAFIYVLTQIRLSDAGRRQIMAPENAYWAKQVWPIDCTGNQYALAGTSFFDSSNNKIGETDIYENWYWKPVLSGSMAGLMRDKACR